MAKYVAFLRGINVGGNKIIKMEDLKKVFQSMEFQNVQTLLASGNVIFETSEKDSGKLTRWIGEATKKAFGHDISVIVRSIDEIKKLIESNPFKEIKVTPQTRLYVTFLGENKKSKLKIPYQTPEKDFKILSLSDSEVCSVVVLSPNKKSVDLMKIIEKEFGKNPNLKKLYSKNGFVFFVRMP